MCRLSSLSFLKKDHASHQMLNFWNSQCTTPLEKKTRGLSWQDLLKKMLGNECICIETTTSMHFKKEQIWTNLIFKTTDKISLTPSLAAIRICPWIWSGPREVSEIGISWLLSCILNLSIQVNKKLKNAHNKLVLFVLWEAWVLKKWQKNLY